MDKIDNIAKTAVEVLKEKYPASCSLDAGKDYELLISVRLSAQCTDARVNIVTKELFSVFPTLKSIADAEIEDIEKIIHPCGLFHTKARDIKACAEMLIEKFGGKVPTEMDDLLTLPGVGRKTANLIRGDIYGLPAIVTDTHCIRIANKLGLCDTKDPYKVEMALSKIIEPGEQSDFCHRIVHFGRDICTARSPKCGECPLSCVCRHAKENETAAKEKP